LAERADLVSLTTVGSVDEGQALLLRSFQFLLAAVVEGLAEFRVFVELSRAGHARGAIAGETLADGGGGGDGGGSEFHANEAFALAVDAVVGVSRVLQLPACIAFEEAEVEELCVGVQIDVAVVDRDGILEIAVRHSLDCVGQTSCAGVDVVDQEGLDSRVAASF
jgi:hypothetical protein